MQLVAHEQRLRDVLTRNRWLMSVLETARDIDPPEWVVGSGVIRNVVWDDLHGYTEPTAVQDVDVAFFDPADVSRERDAALERELADRAPKIPWEVTNQAGVHLWYEAKFGYPIPPARSIEDAVGMWPETATSVAVRLTSEGNLDVIAPLGLGDLFGLVLRRNPRQITREFFLQRLREKQVEARWPLVQVVHD